MARIVGTTVVGAPRITGQDVGADWTQKLQKWARTRRGPLSRRQTLTLITEIADLLESGVDLFAVLTMLKESLSDTRLVTVADALARRIAAGASLHEAVRDEGLPVVVAAAVRAGEEGGKVASVLREVADELEREVETLSAIRRSAVYPVAVLSILLLVVVIFLVWVLPRISVLLPQKDRSWLTIGMMAVSNAMIAYWPALVLLVGALVAGTVMVKRSALRFDIPIVGQILHQILLVRLFGHLSLLTRSGVHLARAFDVAGEALADPFMRALCARVVGRLRDGATVAAALREESLIPRQAVQLVATGEQAGLLTKRFERMHKLIKAQVDRRMKTAVAALSPVLLVIVGVFIVLVFFGFIYPLYQGLTPQNLMNAGTGS